MTVIKPIRTAREYRAALAELEKVWGADAGTPEADRGEILVMLIDAYEREHEPIPPPDPVEAILFRMEQLGMSRRDLEPLLGSRARVSEILNRKRNLSIDMIRRLTSRRPRHQCRHSHRSFRNRRLNSDAALTFEARPATTAHDGGYPRPSAAPPGACRPPSSCIFPRS
jgi:HTH-type transcriptional regulator/antitoxin HigA